MMGYNGSGPVEVAAASPFLVYLRSDAFVNNPFVELLQIVSMMYIALAVEPVYAFAVVQTILQLARGISEHIKKQPPSSLRNSGGCF